MCLLNRYCVVETGLRIDTQFVLRFVDGGGMLLPVDMLTLPSSVLRLILLLLFL